MPKHEILPPSLADLEALANERRKTIPKCCRRHVQDVVIQVQDFPDEDTGTRDGSSTARRPVQPLSRRRPTRQSVSDVRSEPDMIFLYRRPLLDYWCDNGEDLAHVVRQS